MARNRPRWGSLGIHLETRGPLDAEPDADSGVRDSQAFHPSAWARDVARDLADCFPSRTPRSGPVHRQASLRSGWSVQLPRHSSPAAHHHYSLRRADALSRCRRFNTAAARCWLRCRNSTSTRFPVQCGELSATARVVSPCRRERLPRPPTAAPPRSKLAGGYTARDYRPHSG